MQLCKRILKTKCFSLFKKDAEKILLRKKCFVFKLNSFVHCTARLGRPDVGLFQNDTIFALSSGYGKCGVAVIRVSGPHAQHAILKMCCFKKLPKPRVAHLQRLIDPHTEEAIDMGLVMWFPSPHSFTGEDCVEFQVHGGPAVIAAITTCLGKFPDFRHAEAGEFTKRAFLNEKLDLTEVEGLADLIHAETEIQRKQALRQMEGDLGKLYTNWRNRIVKVTANIEAFIDFAESDTVEENIVNEVSSESRRLETEIYKHLNDSRCGERLRNGVNVVIVGKPNVGKSTLLNTISQKDAAIVSPIPGTTRDIVESALNIGGYPVLLSDTAGLRKTTDSIENEGVKRAIKRAGEADLSILVLDSTTFSQHYSSEDLQNVIQNHINELSFSAKPSVMYGTYQSDHISSNNTRDSNVLMYSENLNTGYSHQSSDVLIVLNKTDMLCQETKETLRKLKVKEHRVCCLSCSTGEGLEEFLDVFQEILKLKCGNPLSGSPSLTQVRHRYHLEQSLSHLQKCLQYLQHDDVVLAAQCLRKVLHDTGKITGKISTEDLLDVIFRDFCIGK